MTDARRRAGGGLCSTDAQGTDAPASTFRDARKRAGGGQRNRDSQVSSAPASYHETPRERLAGARNCATPIHEPPPPLHRAAA
jgi:hypothetical protein